MMYCVPYVEFCMAVSRDESILYDLILCHMWNFIWLLAETEAFRMTSPNYQIGLQLTVIFLSIIYYNSVVL
jgi:hypothetical protein